jgi:hypothetical protein
VYCSKCGKEIIDGNFCKECGTSTNEIVVKEVNRGWFGISIFLPFVGFLGGLYYTAKGYKNGPILILFSLGIWFIWWMVFTGNI